MNAELFADFARLFRRGEPTLREEVATVGAFLASEAASYAS